MELCWEMVAMWPYMYHNCSYAQMNWDVADVDVSLWNCVGSIFPWIHNKPHSWRKCWILVVNITKQQPRSMKHQNFKNLFHINYHLFGWSTPFIGDITSTHPTRHTKYVCEFQKPTQRPSFHPKCIPKTQKTCTQCLPTGHWSGHGFPCWVPILF